MKIGKYISVFILALLFTSCEKFIGGDINADPNNPASVPIFVHVPAFQIALADVYGGEFCRFNCMLSQQVEGLARCGLRNQYTGLTPEQFDATWQTVYEKILNEIKIAGRTAVEDNLNHYKAILDITEAFTLMMMTDVWDDMPYTEALQGISNTNPAFDSQESIYNTIMNQLDNAVLILEGASGPLSPGDDDVFYGGDVQNWIKAAYAIKARGLIHLNDYSGALAAAQSSFISAADNLAFQYPDANAAGQWYRFNRDRTGDFEFHPTLRSIMSNLNDTIRLEKINQEFTVNHTYLIAGFLQELITYREMQFVVAECAFRNGNGAVAHQAYLNGIEASFARMGANGYADYVAQPEVDPGEGNLTLEHIMTQKYIAMFLQPETYSDYRRTNIPDLEPVSGSNVPVRWNYPSAEYLFNSNLTEAVDFYNDKVWWNR